MIHQGWGCRAGAKAVCQQGATTGRSERRGQPCPALLSASLVAPRWPQPPHARVLLGPWEALTAFHCHLRCLPWRPLAGFGEQAEGANLLGRTPNSQQPADQAAEPVDPELTVSALAVCTQRLSWDPLNATPDKEAFNKDRLLPW